MGNTYACTVVKIVYIQDHMVQGGCVYMKKLRRNQMREILFRGKWIDHGEFVEGLLMKMWEQYHIISPNDENTAYPINLETVGQYTGFTDKNGNKIFEGDICCFCNEDNEYTNYEVMWFTNKWVVIMCGTNTADDLDLFFCERAVVISNIHDNPELLEESK